MKEMFDSWKRFTVTEEIKLCDLKMKFDQI